MTNLSKDAHDSIGVDTWAWRTDRVHEVSLMFLFYFSHTFNKKSFYL